MLKNYTSEIPVTRSISWIEQKLAGCRATQILKKYTADGRVTSIAFMMTVNGMEVAFQLPARIAECERVLMAAIRKPRPGTVERVKQQAERTAWKILADWIDAQMAMIELSQVEVMEVFLAYVYNPATNKTFFETVKLTGFKALLPAAVNPQSAIRNQQS